MGHHMFSLAGAGDALPTKAATPCVVGVFSSIYNASILRCP